MRCAHGLYAPDAARPARALRQRGTHKRTHNTEPHTTRERNKTVADCLPAKRPAPPADAVRSEASSSPLYNNLATTRAQRRATSFVATASATGRRVTAALRRSGAEPAALLSALVWCEVSLSLSLRRGLPLFQPLGNAVANFACSHLQVIGPGLSGAFLRSVPRPEPPGLAPC